jgi:hypothetical protein
MISTKQTISCEEEILKISFKTAVANVRKRLTDDEQKGRIQQVEIHEGENYLNAQYEAVVPGLVIAVFITLLIRPNNTTAIQSQTTIKRTTNSFEKS